MYNDQPSVPFRFIDDPALAMSQLWQRDYDELHRLCSVASRLERTWFDATNENKKEAERAFITARDERDRLMDRIETAARAITKKPAQSIEGVTAKLAVAILQNEPKPNSAEPPWPMLRSCIDDLTRLSALLARG